MIGSRHDAVACLGALLIAAAGLAGCAEAGQPYAEDSGPSGDPAMDAGTDDVGADPGTDVKSDTSGPDTDPAPDTQPPPPDCPPGTQACGVRCADLHVDPDNCGGCGRTCVIPQAAASCVDGGCALAECEPGFSDRDGVLANGCEAAIVCEPGGSCETVCGSEGRLECVDDEPTCATPAETCNAVDDNCDGGCDEGGLRGCRVGVHRAHGNGHIYTTDLGVASSDPYSLERENYFFVYAQTVPGTRPVFLCRKGNGKRFLTSDTACEMAGGQERQLGHWSPTELCGAVPLYRLYHEPTQNHFYTLNAGERDNARDNLGYRTEGIAGWVWNRP
mgnify:CR=1 FL=1